MIWQDIYYLWILILVPIIIALVWWQGKEGAKKRQHIFQQELFNSLRKGHWALGSQLRFISLCIGIFLLIVAAAGPKVGTEVREVKRRGVDMVIALDLSASMNAEDVRPSRLEKAKYEVNRLIDRLKGDRVGLVIFTGEAYLQSPMTLDYSALKLFLNIADTDQMPSTSTNFTAALETTQKAFESAEENGSTAAKVLLIISDGENQEEGYEEALDAIKSESISVYTLGIGTQSGTTIPLYEEDTGRRIGYKRDKDGKVVTTRLESGILRSIAEEGGGNYYEIQRGNDGIDAFLARVDELEKGEFSSQEYADFKNQYQWLAAFGLLTVALSIMLPAYKANA